MNGLFCVAVHALVYLHKRGGLLSSEELAGNICTNPARVRKVMSSLKKAGLVEGRTGSEGGYRFTGEADAVTLAQVARALDVRIVEQAWHSGGVDRPCMVASGMAGAMDELFDEMDRRCRSYLDGITLADVERRLGV